MDNTNLDLRFLNPDNPLNIYEPKNTVKVALNVDIKIAIVPYKEHSLPLTFK